MEQDETTNVIIYTPASPGYGSAPTVMLAAHMDMICATNPGVVHDFDHEPLRLVLDGPHTGPRVEKEKSIGIPLENIGSLA